MELYYQNIKLLIVKMFIPCKTRLRLGVICNCNEWLKPWVGKSNFWSQPLNKNNNLKRSKKLNFKKLRMLKFLWRKRG